MRNSGKGKKPKNWFRRILISGVFIVLFTFVPAITFAPVAPSWLPTPLANWSYDMRLLIGRMALNAGSLKSALSGNSQMNWRASSETVTFAANDLELAASIYKDPDVTQNGKGILVLHGSTPKGRKLGFYNILATHLAAKGYTVMVLDQRGYGQSDDPPNTTDKSSMDFSADVQGALDFLANRDEVTIYPPVLIGHSFGADVALTATAVQGVEIEKLILIGPGRRFFERMNDTEGQGELDYQRRREMRFMKLRKPVSRELFMDTRAALALENHVEYLADSSHVPVLLLDGGLESEQDRDFLANYFDAIAGVKSYVTIEGADHYSNTAQLGPLLIYDTDAVGQLINAIDQFLVE